VWGTIEQKTILASIVFVALVGGVYCLLVGGTKESAKLASPDPNLLSASQTPAVRVAIQDQLRTGGSAPPLARSRR